MKRDLTQDLNIPCQVSLEIVQTIGCLRRAPQTDRSVCGALRRQPIVWTISILLPGLFVWVFVWGRGLLKTKMAALFSDWLRHFFYLVLPKGIWWNSIGSKYTMSYYYSYYNFMCVFVCVFFYFVVGADIKTNIIKKINISVVQEYFLRPVLFERYKNNGIYPTTCLSFMKDAKIYKIGSNRTQDGQPWLLSSLDSFDIFPAIVERNSTELDRKEDLNVLNQVCVYVLCVCVCVCVWAEEGGGVLENQYGRPGLWLTETFRLLLYICNRWAEFRETWRKQELNVLNQVFIRPSSDGTYYGMVMSVRPSDSPSVRPTLRPGLSPPVFRTFLIHALTYWAEILHMTLF